MIPITTPCSFTLEASGEAADALMELISPSAAHMVHQVTVQSRIFENDIEAVHALDSAFENVLLVLPTDSVQVSSEFNPLYLPECREKIESLVEPTEDFEGFRFTKFGGNPFVVKTASAEFRNARVVSATLTCGEYDMPDYQDLVLSRPHSRVN